MQQLRITSDPPKDLHEPSRPVSPMGGGGRAPHGAVRRRGLVGIVGAVGLLCVLMLWGAAWTMTARAEELETEALSVQVDRHPYVVRSVEVVEGSTYGTLMESAGVSAEDATTIFAAAEEVYDLSTVRLGREIELVYDRDTDRLLGLRYQIDTEEVLDVTHDGSDSDWTAARTPIPYEVRERTVEGTVETSLYVSALEQDLDERAIIALADTFQWEIDFAMDVRKGDTYRFIFEERFLDGHYVMPGQVVAAKYVNDGEPHYAFHFTDGGETDGYYDDEGDSVQKVFLKAPVAFKYISSGFTTGRRYVSAFNVSTGHRAIDYATPTGTPIRAVGAGTVVSAGWNGPYGNFVSVRHNSTYTTNYAHMSKIAVRYGQKVAQGQTIGYVGSTGFSTGPHLHYEMVKWGTKINPMFEEFPSVGPVPDGLMDSFMEHIAPLKERLDA